MHLAASAAVLTSFFSAMAAPSVISPLGILKSDGLDALDDLVGVNALGIVESLQLVKDP